MRVATLSLDFGLLLLVLVALLQTQGTVASSEPNCPSENCVPPSHCESQATSGSCSKSGNVCCALVKQKYRTLCRQHGGDCTAEKCPARYTARVNDCPADRPTCCIWV